ncbi:hypothetical protein QBZ16_002542 [Prototheca wickerhamii]|uniref:Uncharacterized protein n=1 Tax=Prototheca wickerhamii TaxID=3111 RepID=A0AAD9MP23_PROWI|nr:hypothetical protein QBZ16_002542 [Prototheca wickerhamii]
MNVTCTVCFRTDVGPVVYIGYPDDDSTRKLISQDTVARLTSAQVSSSGGVLYVSGSVSNLAIGTTYTLILTCNKPTSFVWSMDFVATDATKSFNYAAAPVTCTSTRYTIVRSSDGMHASYK